MLDTALAHTSPLLTAAALGLLGQVLRALIGLHKALSQSEPPPVYAGRLALTLLLGALAGVLAWALVPAGTAWSGPLMVSIAAAGYAGADAIEGLMAVRWGAGVSGPP